MDCAVKPAATQGRKEAYFQPDNVLYKTRMRTRGTGQKQREREGKGPTNNTALLNLNPHLDNFNRPVEGDE